MKERYRIEPASGKKIPVRAGDRIAVIDEEGGQVADFFAVIDGDSGEFLSPGVTMDINESLHIGVGDTLYSNRYRPLFEIERDDVGEHDLLHPCCSPAMYDFFYHNGAGHPNCLDNINGALGTAFPILRPVNLFMHTAVAEDGSFSVCRPPSKAGDAVVLKALEDMILGVAACSVSESECNAGKCTAIIVEVE
ncbi:urea carboxylase-associated protein 1 [Aedoeadaptatus ivorii]|uniref:Urea carboxylase-associated protein 1 n=1 Tax=Aedoeadaptatus ivorii TaxID=54006 RepID=A0A3S5F7S6_9FIRM|nr:urea carboxylase-associated family protein [Peptoniphilus ivorii]VEJ34531.1 urea carboxylase-associated protein 1 [Peptoniphilus ivorii]